MNFDREPETYSPDVYSKVSLADVHASASMKLSFIKTSTKESNRIKANPPYASLTFLVDFVDE